MRVKISEKGDSVPLHSSDFFIKQLSMSILGCLKKELLAGSYIMQRLLCCTSYEQIKTEFRLSSRVCNVAALVIIVFFISFPAKLTLKIVC